MCGIYSDKLNIFSGAIDDVQKHISSLTMKVTELQEKKKMLLQDFDCKRSYLFLSSIYQEIKELDIIIHETYRNLASAKWYHSTLIRIGLL
jgi:uncharacterized protein YoxC